MEQVESVIFDWGGVLIEDPAPGLMKYCAEALGVSVEAYTRAHGKFGPDFQKGLIPEAVFWTRICAELGKAKPDVPPLWGDAFSAVYSPREEVFSLARRLHEKGTKIALLSNTEVPAMQHFHVQRYDMFNVTVFSCAEGTRKPERRVYELTLARLGSQPDCSVFIDDKQEYIDGARQVGLHTILFKDIGQVRAELAGLGVG
jgi:putative hydrolase of the HAD superfamily